MPWRHAPHTADVVLEAEAGTFEALCGEMAAALTALLVVAPDAVAPSSERRRRLVGASAAEVLHDCLTEVLLAFELERSVATRVRVRRAGDAFELVLHGAPYDPDRHGAGAEVKAVTRHDLEVARSGDAWRARALVDL